MELSIGVAFLLAVAGLVLAARRSSFVVPEGFYGLLYRRGKSLHRISPGRHCYWRRGYSVRLVDMRRTTLGLPWQQVVSADHVEVKVAVTLTYQIVQAETAMHSVEDWVAHLQAAARLGVRSVVGAMGVQCLTHSRREVERQVLARVEVEADRIGIVIHALEFKEVIVSGREASKFSVQSDAVGLG